MRKSLLGLAVLLALVVVGCLLLDGGSWVGAAGGGDAAREDVDQDPGLRDAEAPGLRGQGPSAHDDSEGAAVEEAYAPPRGALTGRVLDPSGRPLAGADVYLHHSASAVRTRVGEHDLFTFLVAEREVRATTDPDGRFAMEEAGDGPAWVVAYGEGYGMRAESVRLRGGQAVGGGVEIMLDRGRRFEGRVVNRHGAGVAGVRVALVGSVPRAGIGYLRGASVTGADGRYKAWTGTRTDGGTLVAYAMADVPTLLTQWVTTAGDVTWPAFVDVTVRFVVGAKRAPLEGLAFSTGTWGGDIQRPMCMAWSVTDADGKARVFLVPGVLAGAAGTHAATGPFELDSRDLVEASTNGGAIPAGREAAVEIQVGARAAATFVGTVRDEQGRPIAGALVVHHGHERRTASHGAGNRVVELVAPVKATTADDGSFVFSFTSVRSAAGVSLGVRAPGFAALDVPLPTVSESRLRLPRHVDITLRRGVRLAGRVLGVDGRPLAGASVTADVHGRPRLWGKIVLRPDALRMGAVTGSDGRYTLRGLPFGTDVVVTAEHRSRGASGSAQVRTDRRAVQTAPAIRLEAGRSLRVRVLGPGGLVRAGAVVTILPTAAAFSQTLDFHPQEMRTHVVVTGEDGEAEYRGLAPGPHTLLITAKGTAGAAAAIEIAEDSIPQDVTVRLRRSAPLRGRVIDHKGRLVVDFQPTVFPAEGTTVTSASQWIPYVYPANEDTRVGHFRIDTVPPGVPVRLHVESTFFQPTAVTARGGGPPLVIVLQPWDAALLEQIEAVAAKQKAILAKHGQGLEAAVAKNPELAARVALLEAETERLRQKHREVSGALSCGGGGRG